MASDKSGSTSYKYGLHGKQLNAGAIISNSKKLFFKKYITILVYSKINILYLCYI